MLICLREHTYYQCSNTSVLAYADYSNSDMLGKTIYTALLACKSLESKKVSFCVTFPSLYLLNNSTYSDGTKCDLNSVPRGKEKSIEVYVIAPFPLLKTGYAYLSFHSVAESS